MQVCSHKAGDLKNGYSHFQKESSHVYMSLPESKQTVQPIFLNVSICKWPRENNSGKRRKGRHSVYRREKM